MSNAVLTIFALLSAAAIVSVFAGVRAERRLRALQHKQEADQTKIREIAERMDVLKTNFMKVLRPIRQNTESIGELDDDLSRVEKRIDEMVKELKKREESPASS